jgi:putative hemin transport protein
MSDAAADVSFADRTDQIRAAFDRNRRKMTVQLARELGVPEVDVIRALPAGMATELDVSRWEELVRGFEPLGKLHVIVTNGAVTLESFGQFGNFSTFGSGDGGYFNVQSNSLDMHVRPSALAAAFAVEKPGHMDGVNTLSFQFYDHHGAAAFKVFLTFGGSAPPPEKRAAFDRMRAAFRLEKGRPLAR